MYFCFAGFCLKFISKFQSNSEIDIQWYFDLLCCMSKGSYINESWIPNSFSFVSEILESSSSWVSFSDNKHETFVLELTVVKSGETEQAGKVFSDWNPEMNMESHGSNISKTQNPSFRKLLTIYHLFTEFHSLTIYKCFFLVNFSKHNRWMTSMR